MKKIFATLLFVFGVTAVYSQTTYYWVGGASSANINASTSWNTSLDGSGSSRPSSSGATDILVFDGTNLGGATPVTGPIIVNANAGITAGQMKFVNNATVSFIRGTSGTSTLNLSGGAGEDFVVEAGSNFSITSTVGSIVIAMVAANTGRVSGNMSMITTLQARIANTTGGSPGSLIFTSGSTFTTNITSASSAYAFGSSSQSSEGWVVFEAGSHLYYNGGYSPHGSGTLFSAIDMRPGSVWHHRATNTFGGNFFNRKSFGDIIVENNAVLTAQGPIYRIGNLSIAPGSTFNTYTSGQTVVLGNLEVNGDLLSPSGTNAIVMGGSATQTISGSGIMNIPGLVIGDNAYVTLQKDVTVQNDFTVFGHLNFNTNKVTGAALFRAVSPSTAAGSNGSAIAGRYFIIGMVGVTGSNIGMTVTGPGVAANTTVVNLSGTQDSVYISQPLNATGSGAYGFISDGAVLQTSNTNGFDAITGSVAVTGSQMYEDGIHYIIDAPTTKPFGLSTSFSSTHILAGNVIINAPVTTNTGAWIAGTLQLNSGKTTIRQSDTIRVLNGGSVNGSFSTANYFITEVNTTSGAQGIFRRDGVNGTTLFPIGTLNHYLPATVTPATASDIAASVFQGITSQGTPNGTPLTSLEKQTKVDAVWNINRVNGTGSADMQLQWVQPLEGSTFATLANSEIGVIINQNPGWSLPTSPGDNTNNIASVNVSSFGAFSVGAKPPANPFVFNALPAKTYGDPDFDAGVISLNTTTPITYTSSNAAVATIVNNKIHIVGVGTTTITASQASDGFYLAANVSHSLVVNRAPLTIKADNKAKPEGDPNPPLTITYTGFVYGEASSVLTTQPSISTTAITSSPPGTYPITVSGAAAANYSITYVNGVMTVTPRQPQVINFPAFATKTYGNADFAIGATSTNTTIPITYTSSNPAVATIVGNNIHIVGAGTTTITASQAGNDFFFPATNVSRALVVNKANLTIRAADTTKVQGDPNPQFQLTYTGFVLGEDVSRLQTPPSATTTAVQNSAPGYYPITPSGGAASNYNLIYVEGRLTVLPRTGADVANLQAFMSSSNTLTVRIYSAEPDLANIILYDATGKPVVTKNTFLPRGFINVSISLSNVASGIYTVTVHGNIVNLKKNISIVR